ncbi:hypothetical protein BDN72DRAFT_964280 [Pluteus cervinus]|uniref:Uncharacterized protein n=1 Tax=Pluteus cervinus TaxID=181527 RepID=A0ACD3AAG3_9AGAR|nr:hypothetical protein BDN72DRAFT_964280 [Pluteus cervinus]
MASESNTSTSHLDEIADSQPEGYYLSKKFRSPLTDVTFESVDTVRFRVYKTHLATFSGGFPPAELISDSQEIVSLPEGGVVLDNLFSFARPGRYPIIHALNMETLVLLADAAEKYEVYGAITACNTLMRVNLTTHPLQVYRYAGRYEYPDLMDDVALFVLDLPILRIFDFGMSERYFRAWLRYLAQFQTIHQELLRGTITMPQVGCNTCAPRFAKLLGAQMPNKTALAQASRQLCSKCSQMGFSSTQMGQGSSYCYWSSIEKIYENFQKFSDFL